MNPNVKGKHMDEQAAEAGIEPGEIEEQETSAAEALGEQSGEEAAEAAADETQSEEAEQQEPEAEQPHGVKKQIGKLTARAKSAEERAEAAEAELERLKAVKPELDVELVRSLDNTALASFAKKANVASEADVKVLQTVGEVAGFVEFLQNNEAEAMAQLQSRNPEASEAALSRMYTRALMMRTQQLTEAKLAAAEVRSRILGQFGQAKQSARATTVQTPRIQAKPRVPTSVGGPGSTGGGSGVRALGGKPSVAKILADAGGAENRNAVAKALEAFTQGRAG